MVLMTKLSIKTTLMILTAVIILSAPLSSEAGLYPEHIAYDINAERIPFSNNSLKLTWKMNSSFSGEFVVGRSENEFRSTDDILKAKLVGVFYSGQEGILIDRDLPQGKNYYYTVISKSHLLRREIDIIKNVNCTATPLSFMQEPEIVKGIKAESRKDNSIEVTWKTPRGSGLKYNVYRSRSIISSVPELEVAEKLTTTENSEYIDRNVSEFGSYYYAVSVTDKSGVEYFTPVAESNYNSSGIFIKGKTLATPLNVAAFLGEKDSVIVKWEKASSRTGKDLSGYEIYRSEEMINSLLKLKFARLISITDSETILYQDKEPGPGKYYYAVFARYSDGAVDINFEDESSYTRTPVMITLPYSITAIDAETGENSITIIWNYSGNSGDETINVFRTKVIPENSSRVMNDSFIGTENIKSGKFVISNPEEGSYYYGVLVRSRDTITFKPGINITGGPVTVKRDPDSGTGVITKKERKPDSKKDKPHSGATPGIKQDTTADNELDYILKNIFYKGRYRESLKELQKYISGTDNDYNRSQAKLFLARTYIELADYRKGIDILRSDDVRKNFPDETKFWTDFATVRLK